jgi:hypothetical protein
VNPVAVTKLVWLIVEVPENEMSPVMGVGTASKLKAKPATASRRLAVTGSFTAKTTPAARFDGRLDCSGAVVGTRI